MNGCQFQQFVGENSQLFRMLDSSGENKLLTTEKLKAREADDA